MRAALRLALVALLGTSVLAGCKKAAPPPPPPPQAVPTPVPATDVLVYTRNGQIWATNWDGSQHRLLAAPPRKGQALWFPSAAPDGTHFVAWLSRPDGTQDVARVDLSGRVTVLTDIGETAQPAMKNLRLGNSPTVSPDGKRIAYAFNGSLWIMDANGYNAETLISDGSSWSPAFSPTGKQLAYINGTRAKYDLWVADLESRDTWQITDFASHSAGHPRWSKDGRHIMVTRSQGDESDVVQVLAQTEDAKKAGAYNETPLADADLLTKDRASASAVYSPSFNRLLFSSQRGENGRWVLVSSDPSGANAKVLSQDTALSPAWLRPATGTAVAFDASPSRPTPVPAAQPTAVAAAPTAQPTAAPAQAAAPTAVPAAPTAVPAAPTSAPTAVAAAPTAATTVAAATSAPTAAPTASASAPKPATQPAQASAVTAAATAPTRPSGAAAPTPKPSAAPTQPPLKAAPLRLRYRASFADDDSLSPASLADLKKLSPRVKQYDSAKVQVIGPLDGSALRGRYASQEARSKARAQAVADQLAKLAGLEASKLQAQPYSPATAGTGAPNSIQVYVELK